MTAAAKRANGAKVWERDPLDWYVEEPRASAALFDVERFISPIWDPACGQGNICEEANRRGYIVFGSDVMKRINGKVWWSRDGERDFLTSPLPPLAPNIVTNPPFFGAKGAEAFIRKSLQLARGKVAVFVDIRFIAGGERANGLFAEHPPHRVWIVTPRVSCLPGEYLAAGNKAGNGSSDWVWAIWDLTAPAPAFPQLGWLRKPAEARKRRESAV